MDTTRLNTIRKVVQLLLLLVFLLVSVFNARNFLHYDEEILLLICFVAFVWTISHYFGKTIDQSFQERRESIQAEMENFERLRRESLEQLAIHHAKVADLSSGIERLERFTITELEAATSEEKTGMKKLFTLEIGEKLQTISLSGLDSNLHLYHLMAASLLDHLLVESPEGFGGNGDLLGAVAEKSL